MREELVQRADAIRAKAKLLESIPGSGLHDNDRNPVRPDLFLAPQRNGLPRQSEHAVFFIDTFGEQVVFAGSDADRVFSALKIWRGKTAKLDLATLAGADLKLFTRIIPRLELETDGIPLLRVRLDTWNDVLAALYAEGLGLSGSPLEE